MKRKDSILLKFYTDNLPKSQSGGEWVVVDGKRMLTTSPEYKKLYNKGIGYFDKNDVFVSSKMDLAPVTVTAKIKPNSISDYSSQFYKTTPYEQFFNRRMEEEKQKFQSSPRWAQQSVGGWNDKRNQVVTDQINQEYQNSFVDFVSEKLQKRNPQGSQGRDSWLSNKNFTNKELSFLTGSSNLPQPNLWAQSGQGLYNVLDFATAGALPEYAMPGIARTEVDQYNNPLLAASFLSVPAKAVQSIYKDNYSLGDALAGKQNDASIAEDIITDPLTWASFGAKGALTSGVNRLSRLNKFIPRTNTFLPRSASFIEDFKNLKKNFKSLRKEISGTFMPGRKEAIDEGNKWSTAWVNHPETQAKIDNAISTLLSERERVLGQIPDHNKTLRESWNNHYDRQLRTLNHAKNYTGASKEYPLLNQIVDFLGDTPAIHVDNWGVSYGHANVPWDYQPGAFERLRNNSPRIGQSWISRSRNMTNPSRTSTTIHENTHEWVPYDLLHSSGLRDEALGTLNDESRQLFDKWEPLRNSGKSDKEIADAMGGKDKSYMAYLSDPTEVHARVMELRKHFGLKPGEVVTPDRANQMMGSVLFGDTPVDKRFGDIFRDEGSFANAFNKLWAVPVGVLGAGTLVNQKKTGGPIVSSYGQWVYPGKVTRIPGSDITMQGVPYPVFAIPNKGKGAIMYPGENYVFPKADYVDEYPMINSSSLLPKAQDGMQFLKDMANSPLFGERYAAMTGKPLDKIDNKEIENYRSSILSNLKTLKYAPVGEIPPGGYENAAAAYVPSGDLPEEYEAWLSKAKAMQNKNKKYKGSRLVVEQNKLINEIKEKYENALSKRHRIYVFEPQNNTSSVLLHETSHGSTRGRGGLKFGAKPFEFDPSRLTPIYKDSYERQKDYLTTPTEQKARRDGAAKYMMDQGIWDPINKPFTKENYDKLNSSLKDMIRKQIDDPNSVDPMLIKDIQEIVYPYSEEEAIRLFNSFVKTSSKNTIPIAKSGGQHGGLDRWFAEKWVDVKTGKTCGRQEGESRAYPACRPSRRVSSETPKTSSEMSPFEKAKFKRTKTSSERIPYNHKRK